MVLFFIAFFGIIYYFVKISGEVVRENAAKNSFQAKQAKETEWICTYTNRVLEQELSEFIKDRKNREAVEKETKEAYDAIDAMFKYIKAHSNDVIIHLGCNEETDTLRIMLAQRGYLRYDDAIAGTGWAGRNGWSGYFSAYEEWDVIVELWCTDEIWRVRGDFCSFISFDPRAPNFYGTALSTFLKTPVIRTRYLGWDLSKNVSYESLSFEHQAYLMNARLQAEREHKEIGVKELNEMAEHANKISFSKKTAIE